MSLIAYFNIAFAVVGLVLMIVAIRRLPASRCSDPMITDALVLVAYLLMINTHYMTLQTPFAEMATRGWHLFDMVVILNICFHAKMAGARRTA